MRISVAMATRNAERYIGGLLESLAKQTRPPHELVVHDDASTDSTPTLLEEFRASAQFPVRVERDRVHRGHVHAFMHAARLCEGDAIAFCDADDVWLPDKLETCADGLVASGASLVLHAVRVVDSELRDLGRTWPAIEATRLVPPLGLTGLELDAPGMAMVFRRELLDAADFDGRPPSRYGLGKRMLHDEWVFFMAGVMGPVRTVKEPLVLYRQHAANDSGGWFERRRRLTLAPAIEDYRNAAEHTAACATYLENTRAASPQAAERLAMGAGHYSTAADSWELRLSLYDSADRRTRARLMRRLLAAHAYRPRHRGGFGRAALGKDLAAGLTLRATPE